VNKISPSLFITVIGCILCIFILAACIGKAAITTMPTSVPMDAWIAQGVPDDTVIKYDFWDMLGGQKLSVTIYADGTAECTNDVRSSSGEWYASGTGQISQEELKRILIEFAKADFFSLAVGDCVFNIKHPPSEDTECIPVLDAPGIEISLTIQGETNSIDYGEGEEYSNYGFGPPSALSRMLFVLGERIAGELKPIDSTPAISESTGTP